jgi:hypothetical protein
VEACIVVCRGEHITGIVVLDPTGRDRPTADVDRMQSAGASPGTSVELRPHRYIVLVVQATAAATVHIVVAPTADGR